MIPSSSFYEEEYDIILKHEFDLVL